MHKSGVNINFSRLKSHILQVHEDYSNPDIASSSIDVNFDGEFVPKDNPPQKEHNPDPKVTTKPAKKWSALFKAQAP